MSKTKKTFRLASALCCLAFTSELAIADLTTSEPAISVTLPRVSTGVGAGLQTRGYTFTLDSAKALTHLGLYTWSNEATLVEDRQIGVWDNAGTLVAELTIPAGGGEKEGGVDDTFFYGELPAPITLSAGETYTVGVWYNGEVSPNAPGIGMMVDFTTVTGFNYGETVETGPPGGAFEKPTIVRADRPNSYLGPNLRFSTASVLPEPANYQDAVNNLGPSFYYQLNETDTASGAADSTGNAVPGVYNGDYVNGPATVGIPGPLEVNGGLTVPGVGGASNLAHLSANAGHITLGDGAAYGANAMTVALFIKAGQGAQGGDRVFTNNLTDGTQSFQIVIGNNGLVLAVDPNAAGANAERTLYLEDNSGHDTRFLQEASGWFHVVASTEGATGAERASNFRIWVNGVDRTGNLMPDSVGWGTDTGMAKIGGRRANATDTTTHSGGQDEVAIFLNRVLTDEEAQYLWAAATAEPAVALPTPVAYYDFDNPANQLENLGSGSDLTGTAGTDPVWALNTGYRNTGAYDFSDDRLVAPIDINPGTLPQMTWGAWVRTDSLIPGLRKVAGSDNGGWDRTIGLDDREGDFRYSSFVGNARPVVGSPGPVNTTDWTFLAASYDQDNATVTVYVDLDASTTADPLVVVSESDHPFGDGFAEFAIGGLRPDNASEAWDGAIDQFFVFDELLDEAQLTALRDRGYVIARPDSDGDGIPDYYEDEYGLDKNVDDAADDPDGDGRTNLEEYQDGTNPNDADSDADGLSDGEEFVAGTNPNKADTDGDGLSDGDEVNVHQTNPLAADSDGDGVNDSDEINAGTDPNDPNSYPLPPAPGLLGYYPFEGSFDDATPNGNHAVPGENPAEVNIVAGGLRGEGADINDPAAAGGGNTGGSLLIPIDANPDQSPEVTFGGWVNLETYNGFTGFMAIDNGGWDRGIQMQDNWGIASGGNTNNVAPAAVGEWQYVVATFDKPENLATLYVGDNDPLNQVTITGLRPDAGVNPGSTVIEVGRYDNQDLDAVVDDLFVFNRELNAHQVNAIRNLRLSALDLSPADVSEVFELFSTGASGVAGGVNWDPVNGLDPTNPGAILDSGGSLAIVLDDNGNGLKVGPQFVVVQPSFTPIQDLGAAGYGPDFANPGLNYQENHYAGGVIFNNNAQNNYDVHTSGVPAPTMSQDRIAPIADHGPGGDMTNNLPFITGGENFTVRINGYIDFTVLEPGTYTIHLGADDTNYFVMDTLDGVVNSQHNCCPADHQMQFTITQVGFFPFDNVFGEQGGGDWYDVSISGPGLARVALGDTANGSPPVYPISFTLSDTDGDGLPDGYEDANGLDKNDPADAASDNDGDGLTALQEFGLGTDPNAADTDGDGFNDGEEVAAGTNPNNGTDFPAMRFVVLELVSPTELSIEASTIPAGRTFHLRKSSTLNGFLPLTVPFEFDSTTVFPAIITVDQAANPAEFYQVWSGPSPLVLDLPLIEDFEAGDGAFVASTYTPLASSPAGPWIYGAAAGMDGGGGWSADGAEGGANPFEQHLTTPYLTVPADGAVTLNFDHSINFEPDWDAGVVEVSVNGAPFSIVTDFSENGYTTALQTGADYGYPGDLNGVLTFNGNSGGFIHSAANLGTLNAGDLLRVRFRGMWDWGFLQGPAPNWAVDNVEVVQP